LHPPDFVSSPSTDLPEDRICSTTPATQKLVAGETIKIFNFGNCKRDFTYVDDIVEGILRVMQGAPEKMNGEDSLPLPPYAVYNIGGGTPENLLDYISSLLQTNLSIIRLFK